MIKNSDPNRTFPSLSWRRIFCSLFVAAAAAALVAAVASSQGGSTSPKAMATLAEGANSGGKAMLFTQRVEDNAFHQKIAPWVMEHTTNGQQAEFFVILAD